MNKLLLSLALVIMSWRATAQDERYFRQLFSGEINKGKAEADEKKYSYFVHTPYYALDLNRDGVPEQIVFVKKDNEDWIEILNSEKKKIFGYLFENKGYDSELFRVELKTLSPTSSILLLYYYEGISKYINFQGTSRVYAITIDNNDLSTMKAFKGPSFFDEQKTFKGHYHKRNYEVILEDLNRDGVKELIVKHRNTSTVFMYKGHGLWQTFNQN
ncbi:hypothetical protein SHI21_12040 [Bacteriovorax sp. PP10]|uniref:VCBS repeat-containing protein n=1 Tax=Bacteriovorax antarcticus TaxID=3088717 RepID=A0ABU5VY59_9BACT|nr:hypothetical protein [Bacteriovorax sp. PP10]MEA9356945.1 hypothetical protein [Bacteriovorax sp. PP10]